MDDRVRRNIVDPHAPFWRDLNDPNARTININGKDVKECVYNLIVTRRDVNLYAKGIRPHRYWKIGQVKEYYGIKGGKDKIRDTIEYIYDQLLIPPPNPGGGGQPEEKDS